MSRALKLVPSLGIRGLPQDKVSRVGRPSIGIQEIPITIYEIATVLFRGRFDLGAEVGKGLFLNYYDPVAALTK